MQKPFKVFNFNGEDCSHIEGLCEKYIEKVKQIEKKYDVTLPNIRSVVLGREDMPFTTIIFVVKDLELFIAESIVIPHLDIDNEKSIEKYKLKMENMRMNRKRRAGTSDLILIREAESKGLTVSMTNIAEPVQTDLNMELSRYFRMQMPKYTGTFDAEKGEGIVVKINSYLQENNMSNCPLSFPIRSGTNVYLVPICEAIQLEVLVTGEYRGDGEYSRYVMVNSFVITDNATKEDVNKVIAFTKKYII